MVVARLSTTTILAAVVGYRCPTVLYEVALYKNRPLQYLMPISGTQLLALLHGSCQIRYLAVHGRESIVVQAQHQGQAACDSKLLDVKHPSRHPCPSCVKGPLGGKEEARCSPFGRRQLR